MAKRNQDRDRQIGARIRIARIAARQSQSMLGERLGVSYQQVQKWEKGRDRVAASMLQDLGTSLGKAAAWFIEPADGDVARAACLMLPGRTRRDQKQSAGAIDVLLRGGADPVAT